ncbi:MAG: hypothetical protein ABL907_05935 [Hyphomicrobium sp.]
MDAVKAAAERIEKKLDAMPRGSVPLEAKFIVTPFFHREDLTVSIQKLATDLGGQLSITACGRKSKGDAIVGQVAYGAATETFTINAFVKDATSTLLLHVEPKDRDPVTILTHWELGTGKRLKPAVQRDGLLTCLDLRGQF